MKEYKNNVFSTSQIQKFSNWVFMPAKVTSLSVQLSFIKEGDRANLLPKEKEMNLNLKFKTLSLLMTVPWML